MTSKILLLWLRNRDIVPIRSDIMKSVTEQDIIQEPLIIVIKHIASKKLIQDHRVYMRS